MALGDLWARTLIYFGIAEEDDDWEDEDGYAAEESLEQSYRERPNVRRLTPRRRQQDFDDWTEAESDQPTTPRVPRPAQTSRAATAGGGGPPVAAWGGPPPFGAGASATATARACARCVRRARPSRARRASRCTSSCRAASTTRSRSPTSTSRG